MQKERISNDAITHADAATDPSSPTQSHSPARDAKPTSLSARSPAESFSSDLSHRTSLSHGSSPGEERRQESPPGNVPAKHPSPQPQPQPQPVVNRSVWEEPVAVTKVDSDVGDGYFGRVVEGGGGGGTGAGGAVRRARQSLSILRRVKRETMVKRAALVLRVCGLVFCLISFSVMAANKNNGWALDSFYRYKEFRYCVSVNVIGFAYSVGQAFDLTYHLSSGNYFVRHQFRYYFDFSMDQILTYLLMSASSSAAIRVEDWESNWGKDKFPEMASASVGLSFMAFVALAASSLISGYALCTFRST